MTEFGKSDLSCFHYTTTNGGMVHVDSDFRTGKHFIFFRKDWDSLMITHSKDYECRADANRIAETLVSQLSGERDTKRERELEAFASLFVGKPVDFDLLDGLSLELPA